MNKKLAFIAVALALAVVLFAGCAATHSDSTSSKKRVDNFRALKTEARDNSLDFLEVLALFSTIDRDFGEELRFSSDLGEFTVRCEKYKTERDLATRPDTPEKNEWWEQMVRRLKYGNDHFATKLYAGMPDARWEWLIKLGIPSSDRVFEKTDTRNEALKLEIPVAIHVLTWDSLGIEKAFRSDLGGGYPNKVTPWDRVKDESGENPLEKIGEVSKNEAAKNENSSKTLEHLKQVAAVAENPPKFVAFPRLKKPIKSYFDFFGLLGKDDGAFDIYGIALTPGDQFTSEAITRGVIGELLVYNKDGQPVGNDWGEIKLVGKPSDSTKEIALRTYRGVRDLPKGEYKAVLSIKDTAESNIKVDTATLRFPSAQTLSIWDKGWNISDIVLCFDSAGMRGSSINRGEIKLFPSPISIFSNEEKVWTYVEFRSPEDSVLVNWTLHLIPKDFRPLDFRKSKRWISLASNWVETAAGKIFLPLTVPSETKEGNYFLAVHVHGRNEQNLALAWKRIKIQKKENPSAPSAEK